MKDSIWNHNPQKFIKEAKRLRALCQRIITGEETVIEGSLKMLQFRFWMKEEKNEIWNIFRVVESESDDLPTEHTRNLWAKDVLVEKDKEIRKVEDLYREETIESAKLIREEYKKHIEPVA